MANETKQKISPAQAAQFFAQMTRQNMQMMPSQTVNENESVSFNLPKVRLTSKVKLLVELDLVATHATKTAFVSPVIGTYGLIRKVAIDTNNGFAPFSVSGEQFFAYSITQMNSDIYNPVTSGRGKVVLPLVASAAGATNKVKFAVDLPLTLNDRDPIGLILTQNNETTVSVTVDVASGAALGQAGNANQDFTFKANNIKITPMVESFSIPALPEAFPDLSVLKVVQGATQTIAGAGQHTLKLPTGQTYRKIAFWVQDANGVGVADDKLVGDIEVIFNQADTPYKISAKMLSIINQEQYGRALPAGLYVLDLSYQGFAGYSGSRDYIDTERLTEFWIKFNPSAAGKVAYVYESLSQLRTSSK